VQTAKQRKHKKEKNALSSVSQF